MRQREGSSDVLKRREKTQSKGYKVTPSDTWMRKEPVSLVEAGGPNGPIILWDYVSGYKGDRGVPRLTTLVGISPSISLLPRYLFLSLSSSLPFRQLSPLWCTTVSFLFKCTPLQTGDDGSNKSTIWFSVIPFAKDYPKRERHTQIVKEAVVRQVMSMRWARPYPFGSSL